MAKNIIMCFDGTKENFGPQPFSNVLKLYQMLDASKQLCYYQPGIGTSATFDSVENWTRKLSWSCTRNVLDCMFAFCLEKHIISAYLFLMKHYKDGDSIYMFGFSRGAFIARVLTGILERVGLLNVGLEEMVTMAWKIYEQWEFAEQPIQPNYRNTLVQEFGRIFCRRYQIKIHFQGLFDSVNSVGLFRDRLFPCTQRSNIVGHIRHALALDERRGKFKQVCFAPNPYRPNICTLDYHRYEINRSDPALRSLVNNSRRSENPLIGYTIHRGQWVGSNGAVSPISTISEGSDGQELLSQINKFLSHSGGKSVRDTECSHLTIEGTFEFPKLTSPASESKVPSLGSSHSTVTPDLVEKWFPGDHSDVGGGWLDDGETNASLSDLPLRWILSEAIKYGVHFRPGAIHEFAERYPSVNSLFAPLHDYLGYCTSDHGTIQVLDDDSEDVRISKTNLKSKLERYVRVASQLNFSVHDYSKSKYTVPTGHITWWETFFWWCLEMIPLGLRIENSEGKWRNVYVPNFGRSRCIPEYAEVHWSIIWRIKFVNEYRPKNLPEYVRRVIKRQNNIDLCEMRTKGIFVREHDMQLTERGDTEDITNEFRDELNCQVTEWVNDNWLNVPDDLEILLSKDPTL
ncbi:uncharacterized protein KNAG_0G00570 [Huiozyma naganishii CBS 8797]|uniref:T6SS Phospholipase effector Tle1-like catalytic domain-containing protein n=1 Tax=Huiozyma naganishii (strain ATCC MYA-139 / BCRC 22969 / CBS 8797 / KCTC 17520 / NBRC 10181 / NCYC 3082 / Yp74L-3) TaxID=1071383 RepID=J7S7R0_HUIN7|nr:hypothetical protein KNAG_0G00570 [Kazachstania naganishii CBS 8797]CCK71114.1 hypothetical protein KNAG_0G00570 [Kazachstania naganishii CBS 8797]